MPAPSKDNIFSKELTRKNMISKEKLKKNGCEYRGKKAWKFCNHKQGIYSSSEPEFILFVWPKNPKMKT